MNCYAACPPRRLNSQPRSLRCCLLRAHRVETLSRESLVRRSMGFNENYPNTRTWTPHIHLRQNGTNPEEPGSFFRSRHGYNSYGYRQTSGCHCHAVTTNSIKLRHSPICSTIQIPLATERAIGLVFTRSKAFKSRSATKSWRLSWQPCSRLR